MIIQNMFEEDINRPINGVIKVDQDELGVIEQEVKEYVITKELKKHFISFFNYYKIISVIVPKIKMIFKNNTFCIIFKKSLTNL